ncbi:hypothetical protein WDZ17_09770 [Pseudokineococcus basanitobsidens]|uniref:Fibronectin type-III domain-containing protein n=1 Tax=Pseudokineococcus basanitobsidens TaxID=1926649 RepID=A0ABU8RKG4_9ACTN
MSAPVVAPTTTEPQPPTDLTAELGDTTTTLRWTASETPDLTGYRLWVDTDEPVDLLGDALTYQLSGLDAGKHLVQLATVTADGVSGAVSYSFAVPYPEASSRPPSPSATTATPPSPSTPPSSETSTVAAAASAAPVPPTAAVATPTRESGTSADSRAASRRSITVEMDLIQIVSHDVTLGEPEPACDTSGTDGYSDIGIGASITVRGASGSITGTGKLKEGRFLRLPSGGEHRSVVPPDDYSIPYDEWEEHDFIWGTCVYSGTLDVPTDDFYTVEVTHRGEISVSETDLQANGGVVSTSLG